MNDVEPLSRETDFGAAFTALTSHRPMPWQEALYQNFVAGDFSRPLSLPTGLGKTTVIHIWLLALAAAPVRVPRRLVYVVNRRTIVDQATREAEKLRRALTDSAQASVLRAVAESLRGLAASSSDSPLAISTLRGQFADNGEWCVDPARPAIIVGTVDMVGSRLLFSAYGRGFRSRPLHAAFLGQDALIVHDEAHLEPAFQILLEALQSEQQRRADFRPLRVMALTATPRGSVLPVELTPRDLEHDLVKRRLGAQKRIRLHALENEKRLSERVLELALAHRESGDAILVFLRRLEDVARVASRLPAGAVQQLTGTLRGLERDQLVNTRVFQRFLPSGSRNAQIEPADGTVFLVCTSAGEVGIDISADHLVCDLTPFESMAQRLGRVNRYGEHDATVDVVHPIEFDSESDVDSSRQRTLALLARLEGDGSPKALAALPAEDRVAAFSPAPEIVPISDILFDAWALTTIRDVLPGRPPVADWLHGIEPWQPPEAYVAWRQEVDVLTDTLRATYPPEDLLEEYPLKPHELLRDRADRIFDEIKKLASEHPEKSVWLVDSGDKVNVLTLGKLSEKQEDVLHDQILVLPPSAGGLRDGLLDARSQYANDVADLWFADEATQQKRRERRFEAESRPSPPRRMRLVRTLDMQPDAEEDDLVDSDGVSAPHLRYWHWYVLPRAADDDGSKFSREPMELVPHLRDAESYASSIVAALRLPEAEAKAVILAAKWHDLGKRRLVWQRSIGNHGYLNDPPIVLAKSGGRMQPIELGGYRHEFGSLLELQKSDSSREFAHLTDETKELILHLIAAHHGRARPHFPANEAFDPESSEQEADGTAEATPLRFARLQRRYGRWGLAYLESLVRAADALASGAGQ